MRTQAYFDLIETFAKPGCPLCTLVARDVDHFLDLLLYERVNEPESHSAVRASRGLCSEHGSQLVEHKGGALATAILYKAAVDEMLKVVAQADTQGPFGLGRRLNTNGVQNGGNLASQLKPQEPCMACKLLIDSEERYVQILIRHLAESRLQEAYRTSDGLCLPHFRQLLARVHDANHLRLFVDVQTSNWERLKNELQMFIDKNDHHRAHEKMGTERDSGQRAIKMTAGERGLFGVERKRS